MLEGDIMKTSTTIILMVIFFTIVILFVYFGLPMLLKPSGEIGGSIFGSDTGISPPSMPP
jgi:hypothetical protein